MLIFYNEKISIWHCSSKYGSFIFKQFHGLPEYFPLFHFKMKRHSQYLSNEHYKEVKSVRI
jgi:hypothetical protein